LDAAERLLRTGKAEFSMRDLAAEAGVSFATPFNQFGNKVSIMRALSARRIGRMRELFAAAPLPANVTTRVLAAMEIAADVMLAEPGVNKAVMAILGAPSDAPGDVSSQSASLWTLCLATNEGLDASMSSLAQRMLPEQLAIAFRGVLSFWTAGEITDGDLPRRAHAAAAVVLLGFVTVADRARLTAVLIESTSRN
jgi:AcrR family transcriptional regulator